MIKRKSEIQGQVLPNFKSGVGEVTMFHFLTEQEARGTGRLFSKTVIKPGNSIGLHQHDGDMEAYYILKGSALVLDNGSEVILEAGDCNVCPDGQSHSIQNVGGEDLEYISIILYTKQKMI